MVYRLSVNVLPMLSLIYVPNLNKPCVAILDVFKPFSCKQVSMSELKEIAGGDFPLPSIENAGKNFDLLKVLSFWRQFVRMLYSWPGVFFPDVEHFVSESALLFTKTDVCFHSFVYSTIHKSAVVRKIYEDCASCHVYSVEV